MNKKDKDAKVKYWNEERKYQAFLYVVIVTISLLCLYPLVYVVSASFMTNAEWVERNGMFLFPHNPTLQAYQAVLSQKALYQALWVSVKRTVVGPLFAVTVCAITGYALSRKDFFGKKILSVLLFITLIYGGGLIPSYLIMEETGMRNTFWVYVIPGMLNAWIALVFRQTFLTSPAEIEESAMVDGASNLTILARILLPINMPTVAVMLLFVAVGQWNSWFDALVYIESGNKDLIPLQLFLQNAFAETNQGTTSVILNSETRKMVVAVIGIVPILCVYPFFQKYFSKGVYMGAVKG